MADPVDLATERAARNQRIDERNGKPRRTARDVCLEIVRADPEGANWREAYERVVELGLWDEGEARFRVVPWRIAKLRERKERTGSAYTRKKTRPEPEPEAPEPEPQPAPVDIPTPVDDGRPVIDTWTTLGSLTVRREAGEWRLIYSARLDSRTVDHLVPLLTGALEAGVLSRG